MQLLKLLYRNALRHKLRTFLTILGLTVAILAFGLLRTVSERLVCWRRGLVRERLVTRNAISLVFYDPCSPTGRRSARLQGVTETVSWGNWFGGVYIEEKNFFPNFAVDPRTYLELYPEFSLTPEDGSRPSSVDRRGAVAGGKSLKGSAGK